MRLTKIIFVVVFVAQLTGCASFTEDEKGFRHFSNGDKLKTTWNYGEYLDGDLYLSTGDIYYKASLFINQKAPILFNSDNGYGDYDDNVYILLNNNILILPRTLNSTNGTLQESEIHFPNGSVVKFKGDIRTGFSAGHEPNFMFDGNAEFGAYEDRIYSYGDEASIYNPVKKTLASGQVIMLPFSNIKLKGKKLLWPGAWAIRHEWEGDFISANIRTSAPLNEWPTKLAQAAGLIPGYYGLEKGGLPFGTGSFLHNDGVLTLGSFKDGVLDGSVEQLLPDGSSLKGQYIKGYKHGLFTQALANSIDSQDINNCGGTETQANTETYDEKRAEARRKRIAAKQKALGIGCVSTPATVWQGRYEQDKQQGWWKKTNNKNIVELRYFNNDQVTEVIALHNSNGCELLSMNGEPAHYSSANETCDGSLFSQEDGTLFKNVTTDGGKIVNAQLFPILSHAYQGAINSGTFTGKAYNSNSEVEYIGDIVDGKKQGRGECRFETSLESCQHNEGVRIDELYLARVEQEKIQQWSAGCDKNLRAMTSTRNSLFDFERMECTVKNYEKRFDLTYNMDKNDGVACDECAVQILGETNEAQACIDGSRKGLRTIPQRINENAGHLRSNQCLDEASINSLKTDINKGIALRDQSLDSFQKYVTSFDDFGKKLERARKQSLNAFYENLNRETHRDIMASLSSIQSNVNKALRASTNEFNSIMQSYDIDQPKQQARYQQYRASSLNKPQTDAANDTQTSNVKVKTISPNRADQLLASYKKKCLSNPKNSWKNNGCVYTAPYNGDRLCYDPSGKICNTGEIWNPSTAQSKQLSTSRSGATVFGSSNSGASVDSTDSPNSAGSSNSARSSQSIGSSDFSSASNETQPSNSSTQQKKGFVPDGRSKEVYDDSGMYFSRSVARDLAQTGIENQSAEFCDQNGLKVKIRWVDNGCDKSTSSEQYKCWQRAEASCSANFCEDRFCGTGH